MMTIHYASIICYIDYNFAFIIIMKIFFRFIFFVLSLILVILLLLFALRNGYLDKQVKSAIKHYAKNYELKIQLKSLKIQKSKIFINKLIIDFNDGYIVKLEGLNLNFDFSNLLKKHRIFANTRADQVLLIKDQSPILLSDLSSSHQFSLFKDKSRNQILLTKIRQYNETLSSAGNFAKCDNIKNAKKEEFSCRVKFNDFMSLSLDGMASKNNNKITEIKAKANINNMPIFAYKFVEQFIQNDKGFKLLDRSIKAGVIAEANFNLDVKSPPANTNINELTIAPNDLQGSVTINGLELDYFPEFENIKDINGIIKIDGTKIKANIYSAKMRSTIVTNAVVDLDLSSGFEKTVMHINGQAKGNINDLISFIPKDDVAKLMKKNINLNKIKGTTAIDLDVSVPIDEKIKNTYDIKANLTNIDFSSPENNINIKCPKLQGKFDGKSLFIDGSGKINDFDSQISYIFNLSEVSDYQQLIKINTKIKANNQRYELLKINSGSSDVDIQYKIKQNIGNLKIIADLKNLDFNVDKLSIDKKIGQRADLVIKGTIGGSRSDNFNFDLTGEKNLKITGSANINDEIKKIVIPVINYNNSKIGANIISNDNKLTVDVYGTILDLAETDMLNLLEKDKQSNIDTTIKIDIDKIRLKNHIWLKDVNFKIKCDHSRCHSGFLDAKVGNGYLKMLLKPLDDKEEWVLTCTNTGAIFKGINLYSKLRGGSMLLTLETSRKNVKLGEPVPILGGTFTLRKFTILDSPFVTRMVSFISLPGFMNFITNNKNIMFATMNGRFNFESGILKIKEGFAEGPYFDFTVSGKVDTKSKIIKVKGQVIPSLYGISTLIKHIPIIGKILSGGKRRGILTAPFAVEQKY